MIEWFSGIRAQLKARLAKLAGNRERHCPKCGAEVSASARSCFMCGTVLASPRRKQQDTPARSWQPRSLIANLRGQLEAWTGRLQSRSEARMTCPQCGAPVSRTAKVCSMCEQPLGRRAKRTAGGRAGARTTARAPAAPILTAVETEISVERRKPRTACPSCGARVSQEMDTCPMCGVDLNRAVLDQAVKSIEAQEQSAAETETQDQERLVAHVLEQDGQYTCSCCGAIASETAAQCTMCGAEFVEVSDEPECTLEPTAVPKSWYMRAWVWTVVALLLVAAVVGRVFLPDYLAARLAASDGTPKPTRPPRKSAQRTQMPTMTQMPTATPTFTPTFTPTPTPTPTFTPTFTPTPTPTPVIHIVKRGETIYGIARYYDVSVAELTRVNNMSTMSYVQPGDELIIPLEGRAPVATVPAGYVMHYVQSGERMSDLVRRYGISEAKIREVNEMGPDDALNPGSNLIIPLEPVSGPSPTVTPTSTPTPGPDYVTPQLIYPVSGAIFKGADAAVVLQWASVGVLADDEWYALTLHYLGQQNSTRASKTTLYMRVTSWRVPEEWYPGDQGAESRFEWWVDVVRRTAQGAPSQRISSPGQERTFEWK